MKEIKQPLMRVSEPFTLTAAFVIAVLGILSVTRSGPAQAAPLATCDLRLRVELTPDVPNPRDPGFVSSLLGDHPEYQLTLLRQDPDNPSVIDLDLSGPDPVAVCPAVVSSMRRDARVVSVEVQQRAAATAPPVTTAERRSTQAVSTVQFMGTVQAGPDGNWVLKRSSGISYAQQARIRYDCDIRAVDQSGFDPTEDDGGVPPDEFSAKRTAYLQAEAACFQQQGYVVR